MFACCVAKRQGLEMTKKRRYETFHLSGIDYNRLGRQNDGEKQSFSA